jgi:protein LSM12
LCFNSIRVTTTLAGTTVEGTLFTVCKITNLIAIKDLNSLPTPPTPSTSPGNYHLISLAHISGYETVQPANEGEVEAAAPTISKAESDALRQREEHAIREAKKWEASRGKGVTKEAQDIFDHIART